jgi:two-component system KDP operon response regulator KdpE
VPRILIVDDDPQFRRTLHLALDSYGYEVEDAADGKEALDSVASNAPDLIVLDWELPGLDGIQTCQALRVSSDVPVIMVSGNRSNSKDGALDAGANDYLAKPFSVGDLLARIESALKELNP